MSDSVSDDLQTRVEEAVKNPRNLGEMKDADAIGTVAVPIAAICCECGSNSKRKADER